MTPPQRPTQQIVWPFALMLADHFRMALGNGVDRYLRPVLLKEIAQIESIHRPLPIQGSGERVIRFEVPACWIKTVQGRTRARSGKSDQW